MIITLVGLVSSMIFYCGALFKNEDPNGYEPIPESTRNSNDFGTNKNVAHFLKSAIIYKVSLMSVI